MSGLIAADIKKTLNIPFVITFHALGRVRRMHQGSLDGFPDIRFEVEDRVVAEPMVLLPNVLRTLRIYSLFTKLLRTQ